jgi:hypothetical protein
VAAKRPREPRVIALMPSMTLGQALAAKVRLIVWCKSCGHQSEPDVAYPGCAARHDDAGSGLGSAAADFVVSGSGVDWTRTGPQRAPPTRRDGWPG